MRRVEIKNRGSVLPCRIFNYLGEDENKIFCKDDLGRVHILNKKLADIRFLDPPEEREIGSHGIKYLARKVGELEDKLSKLSTGLDKVYKELSEEIEKLSACVSSELTEEVNIDLEEKIAKLKGDFERAIVELTNRNEKLTKKVETLEELCKDGDLYKVKALDINYSDLSCGFNELTKKVESLELDDKAFKNAFANLGVPVHPAMVREPIFTKQDVFLAFERWCISINLHGWTDQVKNFISELDKVKEGK